MSPDRTPNRKPPRGGSHQGSRARARQVARRRTGWLIGGITAIVLVAALVIALVTAGGDDSSSNTTATASDAAAVLAKVTAVPGTTIEAVAAGSANGFPHAVTGTPLTKDGKPEILYVGAEYCPYCATERWAMVVALSRFGTFSNLGLSRSSSIDVFPNTPTFTFHGSSYTSQYIAFTGVETATNQPSSSGGYKKLDDLTPAQEAAFQELNPRGGIPFLDFAGRYLLGGVNFDPQVLQGLTHDQIATALSSPSSAVASGVLGAANTLTAAICRLTNAQPAAVCTSAILALADQMDRA